MLLFPEGANFSWPRWRNAIHRLRSTGNLRAAGRALRQSHTLPPRSGGAAAAVAGAPNANLVVLTHNGFCATAAPALGGNFRFTGNCLFAPSWCRPPRCHRRRNWHAGWIAPGLGSIPGSPRTPSSLESLQRLGISA